ncbi:phosphoribosyl-ATP diphosphatase [Methanospirillum lacunae]|uniref:Phosphoribosyl-ATP pyrophosphatase n=1 Tax=Methanospirillum lacunae TaxID=668570 RepID=A0A2V2N5W9_9EURY|nr:phosphoribosyl-ATP diphosphatase [Methanospirillum lacunae]PWR74000.1 phosphoribosyl-ATP diphosphatase [Methanospirillum lacunae]
MTSSAILEELWTIIEDRAAHPVEGSYTTHILTHRKGVDKALEKVGEESVEFIIAIKNKEPKAIASEAADLLYHTLLALKAAEVDPSAVYAELESRRKP